MAIEIDVAKRLGERTIAARFTAGPGLTALFGPSGAGKTSILNMVAGLLKPDRGHIRIGERTLFDSATNLPPEERRVGYVFQDGRLFPHRRVRANLTYGLDLARQADRWMGLDEATRFLGIGHLLDRWPHSLSGGEAQRVAIGRALLGRPRLLLLDEPVSALDEQSTRDVHEALERVLARLPMPALYVSHDLREAARLADRMLWMERGRITADGRADRVLSAPSLPFAQAEDAASVLDGRIDAIDAPMGLARVALDGAGLWIAAPPTATPGSRVRVVVHARDVSLALDRPGRLSVLNVLEGTVTAIGDVPRVPSLALVRVEVGGCRLLARITRRSVAELGLAPGRTVYALVKSAALAR